MLESSGWPNVRDVGALDAGPQWFTRLLEPLSPERFFAAYWLKQHVLCRGNHKRFTQLLSWNEVNDILNHHWREGFRFRLAKQGRDLPVEAYSEPGTVDLGTRVRSRDVLLQLQRGATLVFDAIDEVHRPLKLLAESFEALFQAGTKINIYAGWKAMHGLDLHRDNQEIFILQLDGRKRWVMYGDSVDGVDKRDLMSTSVPPAGSLLDEVISPGDLLYIPRGCYHVAVPLNEPTLHLTIGIKTHRTSDLVRWLVTQLGNTEMFNKDLPYFADPVERQLFLEHFREAVLPCLGSDLLERFFTEASTMLKPRPCFNLPWSATAEGLPPGDRFSIRLVAPQHWSVESKPADGVCVISSHEGTWRLPSLIEPVISRMRSGAPSSMSELSGSLAGQIEASAVRLLVGMLVKQGLATVELSATA